MHAEHILIDLLQFTHNPEHTYDNMDDGRDRSEIQKELREWKMEHEK